MKPLLTERLRIREFEADDLEDYVRLTTDRAAMYWLPEVYAKTREEAEVQFDLLLMQQCIPERQLFYFCAELQTGEFVGVLGLTAYGDSPVGLLGKCGWFVCPGMRRKGYGREAAGELIKAAFDTLGFCRLTAECSGGNTAGLGLCCSLGLIQEAVLRKADWVGGALRDRYVFRLLREEYYTNVK